MLSHVKQNLDTFLNVYEQVINGEIYSPRGLEIKEVRDLKFTINPLYPFTSFKARKLNLSYLAAELMWYLRGDRYDLSICDYGSMWKTLVQPDGGLNSNYGQTIFGMDQQWKWVVNELTRDKDSRRAVMIIGEKNYLKESVNDQRCCQYIQFMIRDNKLHCYAYFRSNDVVWGLSNDVFTIVEIYKFIYLMLKLRYQDLILGDYHHTATSMHVYSRHYDTLESIVRDGESGMYEVPFLIADSADDYIVLASLSPLYDPNLKYSNRILEMLNE